MGILKDAIYNSLVRRNEGVRYEYERYVMEHISEHKEHRFRHWVVLWKLNLHYRFHKKNARLIYINDEEQVKEDISGKKESRVKPITKERAYPESRVSYRESVEILVDKLESYDVISFDVFDTLIFRPFNEPSDLYRVMGMILNIPNFSYYRKQAEKEVRNETLSDEVQEITLEEIYDRLERFIKIDKFAVIRLEEDMEVQSCYANPYMLEVYGRLRKMHKKIVAISDMYLSEDIVKKILDRNGYEGIELYLSSNIKLNKARGDLQKYAQNSLGSRSVIHVGDNFERDYIASIEIGWDAYYYKACKKIGIPYRSVKDKSIASSIYKGIVNNYIHNGINNFTTFYEHGFIYVGYLSWGFCQWLERLIEQNQYDKVIFLARDSEIFYKVYNKFFGRIESRYFFASRFALLQLIFSNHTEEYLLYTLKERINKCNVQEALETFDLPLFESELEQQGINTLDKMTQSVYEILREIIYENKSVIEERFLPAVIAAKKYFMETIGESKNICVVDLGWKGAGPKYIEYFVKEECQLNIQMHTAMFGISGNEYAIDQCTNESLSVYIERERLDFSTGVRKGGDYELFRGHFLEGTFSSEDPSMLEYKLDKDGKCSFIFASTNQNAEMIAEIQEGAMAFCEEFNERTKSMPLDIFVSAVSAISQMEKVIKYVSYIINIFGDVLDDASCEPGFAPDRKGKTYFQMLKKCGLATDSDLLKAKGRLEEGSRIFVCSTYSHVIVTLLKQLRDKNCETDIMLYDDIPNYYQLAQGLEKTKLFKNVMTFTKEDLTWPVTSIDMEITKRIEIQERHRRQVEQRLQVDFEKYEDVYTYYDAHHIGLYIQEAHIFYHLIEDGPDHFKHIYATPSKRELPPEDENLFRRMREEEGLYLFCGQNRYCLSIEVNSADGIQISHPNIIEVPKNTLYDKLTNAEKDMLCELFEQGISKLKRNANHRLAIVFTSVLANDKWVKTETAQLKIYREIVDQLLKEGFLVVIKPHPRDKLIYTKDFYDCIIMDRYFPSEILGMDTEIHFERGVTIASSAMKMLNCIEEKIELGFQYLANYQDDITDWVKDSLRNPEKCNW